MRRRQALAGLVGVTGTALLGVSSRPSGIHATPQLHNLLAGEPGHAVPPVEVPVLRDWLATAHATFDACRCHELALTLPDVIATAQISLAETAGQQHEQIAALLTGAYCLASNLCTEYKFRAVGEAVRKHLSGC